MAYINAFLPCLACIFCPIYFHFQFTTCQWDKIVADGWIAYGVEFKESHCLLSYLKKKPMSAKAHPNYIPS